MIKTNLDYYKAGLSLVNKNIHLFIWSLGLILIGYLDAFLKIIGLNPLPIQLATLIFLFFTPISFAYGLSTVIFLNDSLEKREVRFNYAFKTTMHSLKRIVLYIPIGLILLMILIVFFAIITGAKLSQPNAFKILIIPLSVTGVILGPLFMYTAIFFGIVKKSFFFSLKESVRFAISNLGFTYFILPYGLIIGGTNILMVNYFFSHSFLWLALAILQSYLGLIIISAYLLYYKSKK